MLNRESTLIRWQALGIAAFLAVACAYDIRFATLTPTPYPTPKPTPTSVPTPTAHLRVDQALEELFWMSVDLVGENSGTPEVNRAMGFELAKEAVRLFLFVLMDSYAVDLEARGMKSYETFPFCVELIAASMHMIELSRASSPAEAAPHVNHASIAVFQLETLATEGVSGRPDKPYCDRFEAEMREELGWPSSSGNDP